MLFTSEMRSRPKGELKIDAAQPPVHVLPVLGEIAQAGNASQVYWLCEATPAHILADAAKHMLERHARYDRATMKQVLKAVGYRRMVRVIGQARAAAAFARYQVDAD